MSFYVPVAFVQQFRSNIILLSQQRGSKLRGTVLIKDVTGKYDHFERVGATSMQKKTARHMDTPLISTPHSRRRVIMDDWVWADLIDSADDYKMLIDPKNVYAINASYAAGRQMDTLIIEAAAGNSFAVDENDSQSNVALPSGQKVAYNFGGSAIGLTLAKVRRAKRILDDNEVEDDSRILVVTPQNLEEMLGVTEVTSADYNSVKALVDGNLNTFLGFDWIRTTLLGYTDQTNDRRQVLAFHRTGIGLGIGQMERVRISERADKNYSTQVYLEMGMGAVRIEEEKVVEISSDQSP